MHKIVNALTIFINTKHTGEHMQRRGLFGYIKQTPFLYFFLAWLGSILIIGVLYWIFSLLGPGINLNGELLEFSILAIFKNLYASILAATLFGVGLLTTSGIYTVLVYLQIQSLLFSFSSFLIKLCSAGSLRIIIHSMRKTKKSLRLC